MDHPFVTFRNNGAKKPAVLLAMGEGGSQANLVQPAKVFAVSAA